MLDVLFRLRLDSSCSKGLLSCKSFLPYCNGPAPVHALGCASQAHVKLCPCHRVGCCMHSECYLVILR